jgi:succinate dehydrogenase / fumarate reductase flavoprotein subunit
MAEGGINGALNTMGEDDNSDNHFADTMKAGCDIADTKAVYGLTRNAASVIEKLEKLGVPFNRKSDGSLMLRNFGGQKKKRTAYARSSTGKIIMTALIDEARRFEAEGMIERFSSHELVRICHDGTTATGVVIKNRYTGEVNGFLGPVILAYGGMNGFFPGRTTGTTANSGEAAAIVFSQGVVFSNLEMIQYHPTTIKIPGKRCLISEAARGEGGRLFVMKDGKPWYFMEEKYPVLGNLMPRDVVSREMYFVQHDETLGGQVYLDMSGIAKDAWKKNLPDLRQEIIDYLGIDPAKEPVPVEPGIHYFMGGIDVDAGHRTNIPCLYAAGECCSLYHGANRLGGNSLLGAIYGGLVAAESVCADCLKECDGGSVSDGVLVIKEDEIAPASSSLILEVSDVLYCALGIVRSEPEMENALRKLEMLSEANRNNTAAYRRIELAKMMISSALYRKESRGAHYRIDYPKCDDKFKRYIKCDCNGVINELSITD